MNAVDKILMENMCFFGYHGALPEENKLGQRFIVDAALYLPLKKAGETDNLSDTADYGAVYSQIEHIVTKERYSLIEKLAERICAEIFSSHPTVMKIVLRIKKPEAPINGIFDYVGVEIERDRA